MRVTKIFALISSSSFFKINCCFVIYGPNFITFVLIERLSNKTIILSKNEVTSLTDWHYHLCEVTSRAQRRNLCHGLDLCVTSYPFLCWSQSLHDAFITTWVVVGNKLKSLVLSLHWNDLSSQYSHVSPILSLLRLRRYDI